MKDPSDLGPLQLSIMETFWASGEGTVSEVINRLDPPAPAYTTVATVLSRLEKAGYLKRRSHGRQYVYQPLIAKGEVRHSVVAGLLGRLFGGSPVALVQHLLKAEEVSDADIEHIQSLIDERKGKEGQS